MNPKGNKRNLKAAQKGNTNALKSGVYSERVRAEKAREVREGLEKDPMTCLDNDLRDRYSGLQAVSLLLYEYLIEHGVSDRHGKQRRQAGSYLRTVPMLRELGDQIQTGLAAAAIEDGDTQAWDQSAIRRRLQAIADDHSLPGGARVKALELLRESAPTKDLDLDLEFYRDLELLTDEELEREIHALRVPIASPGNKGRRAKVLEPPRMIIRRLASQDEIDDDDLIELMESMTDLFTAYPDASEDADQRP